MNRKRQRRVGNAAILTAAALSVSLLFAHTVHAEENAMTEDPYLVDDFERYMGDDGQLSEVWTASGDENSQYDVSLSVQPVYEGGYSMRLGYRQAQNGWGGCEIVKTTDWSGCNALQFWLVPDANRQGIMVQINTFSEGPYVAYLSDYPEYTGADTPLLVTLPFRVFVSPNSGKALGAEAAAEVFSIGFWLSAVSDPAMLGSDGYAEGEIFIDKVRAINAVELQEPVLERWSEGIFPGEKLPESEENENRITGWSIAVPVISGIIFIVSFSCFVMLAEKRKRGVNEDGNKEK